MVCCGMTMRQTRWLARPSAFLYGRPLLLSPEMHNCDVPLAATGGGGSSPGHPQRGAVPESRIS